MADGRTELFGVSGGEPIALSAPSAFWAERFAQVRERLTAALGPNALRIEHVGSTALPGIAAKPIIDIQVSVPDVTNEPSFVPAIETAGFALRAREPDVGHVYFRDNPRSVQIHVCQAGSKWERDHLLFRDYLHAHPDTARRYAAVKHAAAQAYAEDRLAYTEAKGPFIEGVLAAAEEWAKRAGWSADSLNPSGMAP